MPTHRKTSAYRLTPINGSIDVAAKLRSATRSKEANSFGTTAVLQLKPVETFTTQQYPFIRRRTGILPVQQYNTYTKIIPHKFR